MTRTGRRGGMGRHPPSDECRHRLLRRHAVRASSVVARAVGRGVPSQAHDIRGHGRRCSTEFDGGALCEQPCERQDVKVGEDMHTSPVVTAVRTGEHAIDPDLTRLDCRLTSCSARRHALGRRSKPNALTRESHPNRSESATDHPEEARPLLYTSQPLNTNQAKSSPVSEAPKSPRVKSR